MLNDPLDETFWNTHAYVRIRGRSRLLEEPRDVLLHDQIYMGSVRSQDDIFEGRPVFDTPLPPSFEELTALAHRRMRGAPPEHVGAMIEHLQRRVADETTFAQIRTNMIDALTRQYADSSILSFFRTATDQRQWAQYGESGRGHAFVFDFENTPWPMVCLAGRPVINNVPYPVTYVPDGLRPPIPVVIGPQDPNAAWSDLHVALLMKSDRWGEQNEERLFRVGIGPGPVSFPASSLRAVVLGYDAPDDDVQLFTELVRARSTPLPVYRLVPDHARHRLVLRQIA